MSTTTIRLPEDLKARVERLAATSGGTVHGFMVQAITEATERMERQQDFHAEGERRLQHMQETGEYLSLDDLRAYAAALSAGSPASEPGPRKMGAEELARFRAAMRRAD